MPQETKTCQNCKQNFVIEPDDFTFYEKIQVPPPTWCPECRLKRRFVFRNERYLYKRTCGLCSNNIISFVSPEKPYVVYCPKCWWSDKWNPLSFGQTYDFSTPFFEQFQNLLKRVPLMGLWSDYPTLTNSEYTNLSGHLKNCYMIFHADFSEDCLYGSGLKLSKDCVDTTMIGKSEICYECLDVMKSNRVFYSVDCEGSHDIYFSKNLVGCQYCLGCVNLRNKSYHIFNQPYSKEDYKKKLEEFNLSSYSSVQEIKEESEKLWLKFPNKFYHGTHNERVSGDYIYHSKNTQKSYEMLEAEDCKYCQFDSTATTRDSYDYTEWGQIAELMYESSNCGNGASRIKFSVMSMNNIREIEYSIFAISSSNLFGTVSVRNNQYCILNKQYTKEEYETLIQKIKKNMDEMPYVDKKNRVYKYGEFFPPTLSPFKYNESTAQEYFPLTKEDSQNEGCGWKDTEDKKYEPTITWKDLPDNIQNTKRDITKELILCRSYEENSEKASMHNCTKVFKITERELEIYYRLGVPAPRLCPNSRHFERTKHRNPIQFWAQKCHCGGIASKNKLYQNTANHFHETESCPNEFETSFAPDRPEIVYCEQCYNSEIA